MCEGQVAFASAPSVCAFLHADRENLLPTRSLSAAGSDMDSSPFLLP